MDDLFPIVRFIHILNGAVALVITPLAMMTAKGGLWPRRWVRIVFGALRRLLSSSEIRRFFKPSTNQRVS
jgi:hypothetical protein